MRRAFAAFALVSGCRTTPTVRVPDHGDRQLRDITQQLLDAVTNGDAKVWDRYLDPNILYISEAGDIETRQSLLAQVTPLPPGISGELSIITFEARQHGDTWVVMHVDDEKENYFGHPIHSQYMQVVTWRFAEAGWKMIGSQVYASLIEPPTIQLPAAQLDDYVGTYALTDSISYSIKRDGDQLIGQRSTANSKPQPLKVEVRDVLFVAGQPRSRKIFLRDAGGHIDRMADRREGRDVMWTRTP